MSHPRNVLRTALSTAAVAAALLTSTALSPLSAHADPSRPSLAIGIGSFLDSAIGLLPPMPISPTAYDGEICADGSPACIDATLMRMQQRLDGLAETCDHEAIFSLAYLRVTEDVRDASNEGYYADTVWLAQIDAVFADEYFTTMDNWDAGRTSLVPKAWQIALKAEQDRAMTGLGNFMLSMNAHINRDFPYVLEEVGLRAADGTSHKADHDAYNQRLDALYQSVFAEEAARFDPSFDSVDIGELDETAAGVVMRGWREMVWRHAEALTLARTPAQRKLVVQQIETYAAAQALLIRIMFAAPSSTKRDAWCATHGRG